MSVIRDRGVVTALKPVRAEQVRRPEQSQVSGRVSISLTITEKTGPVRSKKPAQAEQKKSGLRADTGVPEHHPFIFFIFIHLWAVFFKSIFSNYFLAEAAQNESLYRCTTHHHTPGERVALCSA